MSAPERRRDPDAAPRRLRKTERRQQLLATARELFSTHGYRETTPARIAAAAGTSERLFQRHFPSTLALFLEVLQQIRDATLQHWQRETAALTDPLARLHTIADLCLAAAREQTLEFRILCRALVEEPGGEVTDFLRDFYLDAESLLAQIISDGQQLGVFRRALDPRIGAGQLIRAALGYTLTLRLDLPLPQPDHAAQVLDCVLHGLLKVDV